MRRRSPIQTLAASPVMVGAITTLIVLVAVFLSYNANNGLPFVPSYRVSVKIPDAARTRRNNEVRIGGSRVGVVESIEPVLAGDGSTVAAQLNLKLDRAFAPLPEDSVFRVRYRSAFGLKFLDITRGEGPPAPEGFVFDGTDDGTTASVDPGSPGADNGLFVDQTEFDQIYDTFDGATRRAVRTNLVGFGDAVAGRGPSLNEAIDAAGGLFTDLKPLARTIAAKRTRLRRLISALGDYTRIVAPVALEQAQFVGDMAVAFSAIAEDPEALRASISGAAPVLDTAIATLPAQRSFLADTKTLFATLRPGAADLETAIPELDRALAAGTPVLRRTPELSGDLRDVFAEIESLVDDPATSLSLQRLRDTLRDAAPTVRYVAPVQTVCNYWTYFWTLVPNAVSDRDQIGFSLRNNLIQFPIGVQTIGTPLPPPFDRVTIPGQVDNGLAGYSGIQADGKIGSGQPDAGTFDPYNLPILHGNPYAPVGQKNADCQPGQQGYALGDYRVKGQAKKSPVQIRTDLPGSRGPTTVFFNQDGSRELRDTRVEERQP